MSKPLVIAAIFARGGSKALERKNLRTIGDRSLLTRAIDTARSLQGVRDVYVSTDSVEIAREAIKSGAQVPFIRPAALAMDESPEWLSWKHMLATLEDQLQQQISIIVSVPCTGPLRQVSDVQKCLDTLQTSDWDAVVTVTPALRNPYFNVLKGMPGEQMEILIRPPEPISRRQDAPVVWDLTTVAFAARREHIVSSDSLLEGRVTGVVVPKPRALDIDDEFDLEIARATDRFQ